MVVKRFKGFEFVKVGSFQLGVEGYNFIAEKQEKTWEQPTLVDLIDEKLLDVGGSAYLVTLGSNYSPDEILYVGMYTGTLNERWFKGKRHEEKMLSWHSDNIDDNINLLLRKLAGQVNDDESWSHRSEKESRNIDEILNRTMNLNERIQSEDVLMKSVSLWLSVNPFHVIDGIGKLNISSSIEQYFLQDSTLRLPFNKKGRGKVTGVELGDVLDLTVRDDNGI